MEHDQILDDAIARIAQRVRQDMQAVRTEQANRFEGCWVIQRCTQEWTFRDGVSPLGIPIRVPVSLIYEDWPGYDTPMSKAEMMAALELCNTLFPQHEFRGHRVSPVASVRGILPGSLSPDGEPGSFTKEGL